MTTKAFNQSNQSGGIGSTDSGTVLKSSYHGALDHFQSRGRSTGPRRTGLVGMSSIIFRSVF